VPAIREPTIHDLFRHTAGFTHGLGGGKPAGYAIDEAYIQEGLFDLDTSLDDMMKKLAGIPLLYQPGTTFSYSIGQDVQARLVEILSGMPFDQFLQRRLFQPLTMRDSGYRVKDPSRLAAVHWWKEGRLVPCDDRHGCPKPTNFLLDAKNINSYTNENAHKGGSYGLVGTVTDYWRFAQMMANGGELDGRRILSRNTVQFIARDHLGAISISDTTGAPSGMGFGLGFAVLKDPVAAGFIGSEGSYYWFGAANTMFWIDPKEDIVVVAMTQLMGPTPPAGSPLQHSQLRAMVYGALVQ
jgi:CubicO group peptidase (beta-lactamase class C family)